MAHELPDIGLKNDNTRETAPPTEIPTRQVVTEEKSTTTDIQHDTPCPQEQSNAVKTSDEQPDNNERSSSLEQSSQQPGDRAGRDAESEDPDVRSAIGSEPSSNEDSSQVEVSFDSHADPNQSEVVEFERLSPKVERKCLEVIRRKLLFMWGVSTEDVPTIRMNSHDLPTLRFSTDNDTTVNLVWDERKRTEADTREVVRAQLSTCQAWPRHRLVPGVGQFVLASDGTVPATEIRWEHVQQPFQDDLAAYDDGVRYAGYEDTWHRWCFESAPGLPFEASKNPVRGKIVTFEVSMKGWGETLDAIDKLVHVNLSDFDNRDRIEDLMFDKSFNRSKDYFVALQLLRIINEWIDEVIPSIQEIREYPSLKRSGLYSTEISENLNAVDIYMKEGASAVQRRIRKKTEEINSLRDGLFNATSLRESTKAMALNQAIYVFTVVTVLFTPVSFLATFWALPFLNNPKEGSDIVPEPSAFRNSFIVMPLLTYALVLGIAWLHGGSYDNGQDLYGSFALGCQKGEGRHLPMRDLDPDSMMIHKGNGKMRKFLLSAFIPRDVYATTLEHFLL
ncbi:hypothetical protein FLAG1_05027 [Fusarium langsethiae]|uniref:Uncharacterized protein n=1 Tax=Fusarium langsethiae TaxID=179993 RepID=A0A0N0DF39_FUSLA|nr:hypothetical protein FLAG1_05027 [Fusarium langsethiae]GKU03033.1 unnamed protein product [Fusarium langsethiae]GKU19104.1 unnamed protein product [Fusarium langsethiae]